MVLALVECFFLAGGRGLEVLVTIIGGVYTTHWTCSSPLNVPRPRYQPSAIIYFRMGMWVLGVLQNTADSCR